MSLERQTTLDGIADDAYKVETCKGYQILGRYVKGNDDKIYDFNSEFTNWAPYFIHRHNEQLAHLTDKS